MTAEQVAYREGYEAGRWFARYTTTPSETNPEPAAVEDTRDTAAARIEANDFTPEVGFVLRQGVEVTKRVIKIPLGTPLTPEGMRVMETANRYLEHQREVPPEQQDSDRRAESLLCAMEAAVDAQDAAIEDLGAPLEPEYEPLVADAVFARGFCQGVVDYCDTKR
jgi:hypothetical protein